MPENLPLLIIDDDRRMRELLREIFSEQGYLVTVAEDGDQAVAAINEERFGLILTDLKMPGQDGLALLRRAQQVDPEVPVIMITGHGTVDSAIAALKQGAYDYIEKPFDPEELLLVARRAAEHYRLSHRAREMNETLEKLRTRDMIGSGPGLRKVRELIAKIAPLDVAVLIEGETGTGKELVARLIHRHSRRSEGRFLPINCGAVSETLLESELFGHEKGAFSGAAQTKKGLLELAAAGTLFLDEINSMSQAFQVKILRFLQDQSFIRVGGVEELKADVRLIAAANLDLAGEVAAGRFRDDLYFRLKGITLRLPPLRQRREDIPELAYYFLQKYNRLYEKKLEKIDRRVLDALIDYQWPGNVRELENTIGSAVIMASGSILTRNDLPEDFQSEQPAGRTEEILDLATMEQRMIARALKKSNGNKARAARLLGIDTSTLWRKLKGQALE
jgi:DNA-binding NtrC family response regulator